MYAKWRTLWVLPSLPSVMSSPPNSQLSNDSGQKTLEEKQKEVSVMKDEPIVTRRELWSYYRQSFYFIEITFLNSTVSSRNFFHSKYITMEIMYVNLFFPQWQNLLKVRSNKGSWAKRIYYDFVPIVSQRSRIRPLTRARIIMQR